MGECRERERNEKGREKVGEKVERNDLSKKVEREWSEKVKRVKHGLRNGWYFEVSAVAVSDSTDSLTACREC